MCAASSNKFVMDRETTKMYRLNERNNNDSVWNTWKSEDSQCSSFEENWSLVPICELNWELDNLEDCLHNMRKFNFCVFDYSDTTLMKLAFHALNRCVAGMSMFEEYGINPAVVQKLVISVHGHYRSVPYHNWLHGFSVMQFAFLICHLDVTHETLFPLETFALILGGLGHDLDHPGNTNTLELHNSSELALRYNDVAILENHHCHSFFRLLRNPDTNIFSGSRLNIAQQRDIRKTIVQGILATDMSQHFAMCKRLDTIDQRWTNLQKTKAEDRQFMVNVAMHSADLAGTALPPKVSGSWLSRLNLEFEAERKKAEMLGLPVQEFMCNLDNEVVVSKNQVNFIDFVLTPLITSLVRVWPALDQLQIYLKKNRSYHAQVAGIETDSKDELKRQSMITHEKAKQSIFKRSPKAGSEPPGSSLLQVKSPMTSMARSAIVNKSTSVFVKQPTVKSPQSQNKFSPAWTPKKLAYHVSPPHGSA